MSAFGPRRRARRPGDVSNEEILAAACTEILNRELMAGVQAAVAQKLGLAPSTILRRFEHLNGGFERALIDWALTGDDDDDADTSHDRVARQITEILAAPADPSTTLAAIATATASTIDPTTDERSRLRLLLTSRAPSRPTLRDRLKQDASRRSRFDRTSWQDILNYLRAATRSYGIQRPGLTEAELVIALDALIEGLRLRASIDPGLDTERLYSHLLLALIASAVDHNGDLHSIAGHLNHTLGHLDHRFDTIIDLTSSTNDTPRTS